MLGPLDVATALAEAAAHVTAPQDLDATLAAIVRVALDSAPGVDHVAITMVHADGTIVTRAATDDVVRRLDRLQVDLGEGPAINLIRADPVVRVEHARHEQRWPRFIPEAAQLGLRSCLGVRLHVNERSRGALTIWSSSTDALAPETEKLAELLAVHAELVLGHVQRIEDLTAALATRRVIGLALGILMQRLDVDEESAVAYLTRLSASSETKLRDVAASIVDEHHRRVEAQA